jgi:hypothetical protein
MIYKPGDTRERVGKYNIEHLYRPYSDAVKKVAIHYDFYNTHECLR